MRPRFSAAGAPSFRRACARSPQPRSPFIGALRRRRAFVARGRNLLCMARGRQGSTILGTAAPYPTQPAERHAPRGEGAMIDRPHSISRTLTRPPRTHTRAHGHTQEHITTDARTHAHTHAHTHTPTQVPTHPPTFSGTPRYSSVLIGTPRCYSVLPGTNRHSPVLIGTPRY